MKEEKVERDQTKEIVAKKRSIKTPIPPSHLTPSHTHRLAEELQRIIQEQDVKAENSRKIWFMDVSLSMSPLFLTLHTPHSLTHSHSLTLAYTH